MRFRAAHGTVIDLIRFAYDVRSNDLLQQEPHWTTVERFDIDAKIDETPAPTGPPHVTPCPRLQSQRWTFYCAAKELDQPMPRAKLILLSCFPHVPYFIVQLGYSYGYRFGVDIQSQKP